MAGVPHQHRLVPGGRRRSLESPRLTAGRGQKAGLRGVGHVPGGGRLRRPPDVVVQRHGLVQQLLGQGPGQAGQGGGQVEPQDLQPDPLSVRLPLARLDHLPLGGQEVAVRPGEVGVVHKTVAGHGVGLIVRPLQGLQGQGGEALRVGHPAHLPPGEGEDQPEDQQQDLDGHGGQEGGHRPGPPPGIGCPVLHGHPRVQGADQGGQQAQVPVGGGQGTNPEQEQEGQGQDRAGDGGVHRRPRPEQHIEQEAGQEEQGEDVDHEAVPVAPVHLPPAPGLELRVGVGLGGVGVGGAEDELGAVHLVRIVPAEVLVQLQHLPGQVVVRRPPVGLHPVAHGGGRPLLKGAEQGAELLQMQPPGGHVLKPALHPGDVVLAHRGQLIDAFHWNSSSPSAAQARSRSSSSWKAARPFGVMR